MPAGAAAYGQQGGDAPAYRAAQLFGRSPPHGARGMCRLDCRVDRPGATMRAHGDLPLVGRNLGVLNVIVIIRGRRTRRRPAVARYALEDGDREFVIGSSAGDHREGFALHALHALHAYRRIPVVALLPALAPAPEG